MSKEITKEKEKSEENPYQKKYSEFFEKEFKSIHIDKKTKAKKKRKQANLDIGMIEKIDEATNAGSKQSNNCLLIIVEGNSAKSLAMQILEVIGKENYGVFTLRGKILNIQNASDEKIENNEEIQSLMATLGLDRKIKYNEPEDLSSLRYGGVCMLMDQDEDGSHIKGLIMNFIRICWPTLFRRKGYLNEFLTPLIKVEKSKDVSLFYSMGQYEEWAKENNSKDYIIKYYKGLGAWSCADAKEYLPDIEKNMIKFVYEGDEDDEAFDLAFGKSNAQKRKDWLSNYNKDVKVDINKGEILFRNFINKEFIHFSICDNNRSIPCICDGLKPSQRKILFCVFKKKHFEQIKVSSLAGYISVESAYHHGERFLEETIVKMAQNFVGSNNIPIFDPIGQFGSRAMGGKDSAQSYFIYIKLSELARKIFREEDDMLMNYLIEEGKSIEPEWYLPVIPMVLVNGSEGVGTGWSTYIPCYNPMDLVKCIRDKLDGKPLSMIHPWYRNYNGSIESIVPSENGYLVTGIFKKKNRKVIDILELPLHTWTSDYKMFLVDLLKEHSKPLKKFEEHHLGNRVHFTCFLGKKGKEIIDDGEKVMKTFKLNGKIATTNYVLFDSQHKIKKYNSVLEIINEFYDVRLKYYEKRKDMLIKQTSKELGVQQNKIRYITESNDGRLKISTKSTKEMIKDLLDAKYTPYSAFEDAEKKREIFLTEENKKNNEENTEVEKKLNIESLCFKANYDDYDYLLGMKYYTYTSEETAKLTSIMEKQKILLSYAKKTSPEEMWKNDLKDFVTAYEENLKQESEKADKEMEKEKRKIDESASKSRGI